MFNNDRPNEKHTRGNFCGHDERNVGKCDLLTSRLEDIFWQNLVILFRFISNFIHGPLLL